MRVWRPAAADSHLGTGRLRQDHLREILFTVSILPVKSLPYEQGLVRSVTIAGGAPGWDELQLS